MQYAIFSNLDVLQRHICSNLEWNGKNESQVVFEDEEEAPVALLCNDLDAPLKSTAVWVDGAKLADGIINPENALYITALSNIEPSMVEFSQRQKHLVITDVNGELDLHHLVKSSQLELVDTIVEDDE